MNKNNFTVNNELAEILNIPKEKQCRSGMGLYLNIKKCVNENYETHANRYFKINRKTYLKQ